MSISILGRVLLIAAAAAAVATAPAASADPGPGCNSARCSNTSPDTSGDSTPDTGLDIGPNASPAGRPDASPDYTAPESKFSRNIPKGWENETQFVRPGYNPFGTGPQPPLLALE